MDLALALGADIWDELDEPADAVKEELPDEPTPEEAADSNLRDEHSAVGKKPKRPLTRRESRHT